jgi:hypothetical protein
MIEPATRVGPPRLAIRLGYAGLLPQAAALAIVLGGDPAWRFTALALGYAYAALIVSFLGGLWWGLAAQALSPVPRWVWVAAVLPSLVALASAIPWATGDAWPGPSLGLLGVTLIASLIVDRKLVTAALAPAWWLRLRMPLSLGLGVLTLGISFLG